MKINYSIISWVAVIVLVAGGLSYWISQTRPTEEEVKAVAKPVASLPKPTTVFSEDIQKMIDTRVINGTQPVKPVPANPPQSDPFR